MGWLRGYGVFETLYHYPGGLFARDEHLRRLEDSAERILIPPPPRGAVEAALASWIEAVRPGRARVRVTLVLDGEASWWMVDGVPIDAPRPPLEARALTMALSEVRVPPPPIGSVKSISRLSYELAARLAREAGADDAILATFDGKVGESTRAALFWTHQGRLSTACLSTGILPSVTRSFLLEDLAPVREVVADLDELWGADEVFAASSIRGLAPVVGLLGPEGRRRALAPGPWVQRAEDAIAARVRAQGLEYD